LINSCVFASSGRTYPVKGRSLRDQLGHAPQVLHGRSQGEFIGGPCEPAQSEPIKLEDALAMSKEHLNLLALTA
jgi:hypothetical protein